MKREEHLNFNLVDTRCSYGLTYEDYVEDCKEQEKEPSPENSNDHWNWIYSMSDVYWDDFISNTKFCKVNYPVIITGSLGLWNGKHTIHPVLIESKDWNYKNGRYDNPSLLRAVNKCFCNCDDVRVTYNDGIIEVYAYHHDGCNCFEIRKLSKKGVAFLEHHTDSDGTLDYDVNLKPHHLCRIRYNDIP